VDTKKRVEYVVAIPCTLSRSVYALHYCRTITIAAPAALRSLDFRLARLGFHVRRHEELRKQNKERKDVDHVRDHDAETGLGALRHQQVRALRHHGDKLHQLHRGETRLPPNGQRFTRFGYLGVHAND